MRLFEKAAELEKRNLPFAIITITDHEGVVPRKSGRMLVCQNGEHFGSVGGGDVERMALKEAEKALEHGENRNIKVQTGLGVVSMVIDVASAKRRAVIVGYGHVGRAIFDLLYSCGFSIDIVEVGEIKEERAEHIYLAKTAVDALRLATIDRFTAVIVTTRYDENLASLLESSEAFYIGFLASRSRAVRAKKNFFVPMGFDIGAEKPEEIAISVVSEVLMAEKKRSGRSISNESRNAIIVRGTGDLATAVIIRLHNAGYNVLGVDLEKPTQIRRNVSFAEAMYEGKTEVSGVEARRITEPKQRFTLWDEGIVPILADEKLDCLNEVKPVVIVDAIIAKKNLGTYKSMAPLTIALGPGFCAGKDVDVVIETSRGHELASIIREGEAKPNTGIPGIIEGHGEDRVVRAHTSGIWKGVKTFGDEVKKGETIAYIDESPVGATIDGIIRGMLHDGLEVTPGFKVADIDPRGLSVAWWKPSDKARALAGAVLEVVDSFFFIEHLK
ncbi:MAG: EF2563 family selenium-dependent molybdenum hydroxylase system protein [Sphaerochaetaceae bacterium]|nr:EF2563 family selenium-dependent molybdenum hydroxylase system protein [Sphaerochaetaceae bacterium]